MLRFLRIRNLAVIDAVEVEFESGFNVLTGETGAGKSILVEAVGLLLGGRASSELVRTGEAQATIEAIFEAADHSELIVRREISAQGRSRSFINGALATAAALRDLSDRLVELHGQHEHQALLDPLTHLPLLDGFAQHDDLVDQVRSAWTEVRSRREQLDRSRMDGREKAARLELIAFQLGEIEKAAPRASEDEELAAAKQVLASADRIQRLCEESYATLYDSDQAVLASLGGVWKRVAELATIDPQFSSYADARDSIKSQLEDLAFFLRRYADDVDASPGRLQQVEDRLEEPIPFHPVLTPIGASAQIATPRLGERYLFMGPNHPPRGALEFEPGEIAVPSPHERLREGEKHDEQPGRRGIELRLDPCSQHVGQGDAQGRAQHEVRNDA